MVRTGLEVQVSSIRPVRQGVAGGAGTARSLAITPRIPLVGGGIDVMVSSGTKTHVPTGSQGEATYPVVLGKNGQARPSTI